VSELCPSCGQEMPDQPVRMTEEVERHFLPSAEYAPLPAGVYEPNFLAALAAGELHAEAS